MIKGDAQSQVGFVMTLYPQILELVYTVESPIRLV